MAESFERSFEEQLEALAIIDQWQAEKNTILENRSINSPANIAKLRDSFRNNRNVKSDVKKSSAFVKKIRTITADGIQQCIRDTDTLNLTQYLSEIVDAILATTYKAAELSYVVKLVVSLHQKYDEFTEPLITGLKNILLSVPSEDDVEGAKRKRLNIRFAIELHQQGILLEDELFCQLMRNLLGKGKLAQNNSAGRPIVDLQGVSMMVKFGAETLFGYLPKNAKEIATKSEKKIEDIPSKLLVSAKVQGILKSLLTETYDHLCADLVKVHQDFRTKESKCEKDKLIHGNVTEQKQQEFEQVKKLFERLLSIVTALSDSTGASVPELVIEKEEPEVTSGGLAVFDGSGMNTADEAFANGGIFGDAETRSFYEDLPDLLSLVPLSVLGLTPEQADAMREEWSKKSQQSTNEPSQNDIIEENANIADDAADVHEESAFESMESNETANVVEDAVPGSSAGASEENASVVANKVDALINGKLPECISKQKCDEFCVSFCYLNSKSARKKLISALSRLPRFRTDLGPCYARIVASLSRLFPDLLDPILEALRREFFGILKARRQQVHVDSKIRNVRYQAELVKFRVAPPIVAFRMMKALMAEFTPHNIEMLVAVMEACGRFLFLIPFTSPMMKENLDTMMRLRRARSLDLHQQTLLESAYFAVKPPEKSIKSAKKELTVVQKYARFLIIEKLEQPNVSVETVIKHLRRLPWQDPAENVAYHVVKAAMKVARTKYVSLPQVADCISGLSRYYVNVMVALVDRIFEEIQRSLESPYKREIQRILGLTRLLGELYNYTAIPSAVLFDLWYHVIRFGHEKESENNGIPPAVASTSTNRNSNYVKIEQKKVFDPRIPYEADTPTDLFRAQIVCELLNTTGSYFVRGVAKDKLNRFLAYFQWYLLTKQMIPMHIEFTILDCFDALDNLAKEAAMEDMRKSLAAKVTGGDSRRESKRSTSKKAGTTTMPVVTEWMVSGYQFTRFDTFDTAHLAVEGYEGRVSATNGDNSAGLTTDASAAMSIGDDSRAASNPLDSSLLPEDDQNRNDAHVSGDEDSMHSRSSDEDELEDNEDGDESDDGSESDSDDDEDSDDDDDDGSDDDEEEEDDDDEGEDDDAAGLSEDEAARVLEKMRIVEEDEEFDRAFKSVMQESRAALTTKSINVDKMTIPAILPKPKNVFDESAAASTSAQRPKVTLKLLSRDNKGRIEARQLLVPREHSMVQQMIKTEEEQRLQRERIMERTLQLNAMNNAEADSAGMQDYYLSDSHRYFGQREVYQDNSNNASAGETRNSRGLNLSSLVPVASTASVSSNATSGSGANSNSNNAVRMNISKMGYRSYEDSKRAATTLDLDGFLAESNAAEIRRISSRKNP